MHFAANNTLFILYYHHKPKLDLKSVQQLNCLNRFSQSMQRASSVFLFHFQDFELFEQYVTYILIVKAPRVQIPSHTANG